MQTYEPPHSVGRSVHAGNLPRGGACNSDASVNVLQTVTPTVPSVDHMCQCLARGAAPGGERASFSSIYGTGPGRKWCKKRAQVCTSIRIGKCLTGHTRRAIEQFLSSPTRKETSPRFSPRGRFRLLIPTSSTTHSPLPAPRSPLPRPLAPASRPHSPSLALRAAQPGATHNRSAERHVIGGAGSSPVVGGGGTVLPCSLVGRAHARGQPAAAAVAAARGAWGEGGAAF